MTNRVGKLLIAHPNLPSTDWFYRAVIYIYADREDEGTLGICLNTRSKTSVQKLCNDKGIIYPESHSAIYTGGPVSPNSVTMLHTDEWHSTNSTKAGPSYILSSDMQMFERLSLGDQPAYWRMFSGLCAWKPGQLDAELSAKFPYKPENSWLTATANDDIMFRYEGEAQWTTALALCSQEILDTYF